MEANYYIDPEKLREEIIAFQKLRKEKLDAGLPEPSMSNYLGESILKIANKFAYNPNYINYSFRDEMIGDAIIACIKGVKKIDVSQPGNPFIYLTKCCYYAFLLRIKEEKKELYTKSEIIKEYGADSFDLQDSDLDEEFKNSYLEFLQSNMNVNGDFLKKKKKKKEPTGLEEFLDE